MGDDQHSDRFDVVVVGAGPAGGAAAFTAARLGLSTALIDRKNFPRDKLCGGLFTGRSMRSFTEIFGAPLPDDLSDRKDEIEFFFNGVEAGGLSDVPPMYLTMRWDLDAEIARRALEAGAMDFTGERIEAVDYRSGQVLLSSGKAVGYRILIGADGVNSMIAKDLFGRSFDRNTIGIGLEIEVKGSPLDLGRPIQINLAEVRWGYGWVFPKSCGTTIGVAGLLSENKDMKAEMRRCLERAGVEEGDARIKGHFLPLGDFKRSPGRGPVLLCGDAAGLVDPITGEGIAYAMQSGQLAAISAARALRAGRPEQALRLYRKKLRPIHRSIRMANLIRPVVFWKGFARAFEMSFRRSSTLKQDYMRLLAGEVEYGGIFRAVLLRLPLLLARAMRPGR